MTTIQAFIDDGIDSVDKLKAALQTAMQLEFSTIPPYLCAQWSIDPANDPDDVADMIETIAVQEMIHFALVGNILSAIGGVPDVAKADFVPKFPANFLPGGIAQALPVDLKPLSQDQLKVFMQIEKPEFAPIVVHEDALLAMPATIGDFYDAISAAFTVLAPPFVPNARMVTSHGTTAVLTPGDAQAAIAKIKSEGEGNAMSPDQVKGGAALAHYYVFEQISLGSTLVFADGELHAAPPLIAFPGVIDFQPSAAAPNPSLKFNKLLGQLLTDLESCWRTGAPVNIHAMTDLETEGTNLIRQHIRPDFVWAAP